MTSPTMQLLAWAGERGPDVARRVDRAVVRAQHAHRRQYRRNGDPYIEHPVAVALILVERDADPDTVVAAVLHDVRDATGAPPVADLRAEFGATVTDLVVAVAALERYDGTPVLDAIDRRALQIKVADRLHNMRTISGLVPEKQCRKADHTRDLVAPLARTLGLTELATELDSLATATLRAHASPVPDARGAYPRRRRARGAGGLHRALSVGGLLLPAAHRHRLLQDWDGELHAAPDLRERLRFTASVLLHLPQLAVLTRRTDQP